MGEVIRAAIPEDAPRLSALFLEVFGRERPEDVWLWKYFHNPRGTASYVCEAEGRIVAHCGGTPVNMHDAGTSYLALQSVDFMSSPRYAGGMGRGGVFVRTAESFFRSYCGSDGVRMVYGFPGERHRVLGERLLGYKAIEGVTEFRLESRGSNGRSRALSAGDLELFQEPVPSLGASRDETYLRWRYLLHPLHRYEILEVGGWLRGKIAAILRRRDDAICVMELGGELSRDGVEALIAALRAMGKPVLFWTGTEHPVGRLLVATGCKSRSRDHAIECRYFFDRPTPLAGEMYYTMGDYDVD